MACFKSLENNDGSRFFYPLPFFYIPKQIRSNHPVKSPKLPPQKLLPEWPLASENPGKVLELGENVGLVPDPYTDLYPIIEATMKEKAAGQSR